MMTANEITSEFSKVIPLKSRTSKKTNSSGKGYAKHQPFTEPKELSNGEIKEMIHNVASQLSSIKEIASSKEGDEVMEKIHDKINNLEKDVAVLVERTKKLDDIPTREEMKNIITDVLDSRTKDMASKSDVKLEISNARTTQILWTIGSVLTVVTIATSIILKAL